MTHHGFESEAKSIVTEYVLDQLRRHRSECASSASEHAPLFVGMQGPQGSGKTTLTAAIVADLQQAPHHLKVVVTSLDDFYLKHESQLELTAANPGNRLLRTRGQPGTHDLDLLVSTLAGIREGKSETILLPTYDKSLHDGQGDRLPLESWSRAPCKGLDLLILEGWCLGFLPLTQSDLENAFNDWPKYKDCYGPEQIDHPHFLRSPIEHLSAVNENLKKYATEIYPFLNVFIRLKPQSIAWVYDWRLEQEHTMMKSNGGRGMSDDNVKTFIDGYMPGYELFSGGLDAPDSPWRNRGLKLELDKQRRVIKSGPMVPEQVSGKEAPEVARIRGGSTDDLSVLANPTSYVGPEPDIDDLADASMRAFVLRFRRLEYLVGRYARPSEVERTEASVRTNDVEDQKHASMIADTVAILEDVERLKHGNHFIKQFLEAYEASPDLRADTMMDHLGLAKATGSGNNLEPVETMVPQVQLELVLSIADDLRSSVDLMSKLELAYDQGLFLANEKITHMASQDTLGRLKAVHEELQRARIVQNENLSHLAAILDRYNRLVETSSELFLIWHRTLSHLEERTQRTTIDQEPS